MKAIQPVVRKVKKLKDYVELVVAGDLHWASAESAHDLWWRMFDEHPDALYLFTGDLLNSIACGDKRFGNTALNQKFYSFEALSNLVEEEVYDFVNEMKKNLGEKWIKEHVIGALSGNHPHKSVVKMLGYDPHDLMCRMLGIRNLGYCCMFPIIVEFAGWNNEVMIFAHHGFGIGSRTEGGNITSLSRHAMQFDARVFVYGHVHELVVKDLPPRIKYRPSKDDPWISAEGRLLVLAGTFQRTLSKSHYPSYAEMKGLPVRPLGYAVVRLIVEWKRREKKLDKYVRLEGVARSFYE